VDFIQSLAVSVTKSVTKLLFDCTQHS